MLLRVLNTYNTILVLRVREHVRVHVCACINMFLLDCICMRVLTRECGCVINRNLRTQLLSCFIASLFADVHICRYSLCNHLDFTRAQITIYLANLQIKRHKNNCLS